MPHDIVPIEFEADAPDLDPPEFPSPDKKRSSILAAMKEAGRSLVKAAKRATRKPALAAMMAAGAALCIPHAAQGQDDGCYHSPELGEVYYYCPSLGGGSPSPLTLGNPFDRPGGGPGGDPVDIATGNVFLHAVDYTTAGPNPLQLIRYYNSLSELANVGTLASTLGSGGGGLAVSMPATILSLFSQPQPAAPVGWRTNYDAYLQFVAATGSIPASVIAERPDGQQIIFASSGGTWSPPSDQSYTLTQSGSTWILTDKNETQESYTDSGSGWAQLNSITLRNGYKQTLNYSGTGAGTNPVEIIVFAGGTPAPATLYPNRLQSVTDSYGRSLAFGYNSNGLLSSVATPDSLVVSYGYTYYGNVSTSPGEWGSYTGNVGNVLTSVSYNTSPATSQTYNYAVTSSWPYQIISVVDENGHTSATWSYDSYGRAVSSYQGGSGVQANYTYFSYGTDNTVVSNANGVNDTYNYALTNGEQKITEIDRAATTGFARTAAASQYFSYDSNGYYASFTDWNGNTTNFTNNSLGNPTSVTEAYGTSVARTTSIAYDSTWVRLPATITTTGLTRGFTYDGSGNPLTMTDTDTTTNTVPYSTNGQTREWQWTWNGTGEPLTAQLPRTDLTVKYTYTWSGGALTSITDPVGNATGITASTGGGYPTTIVDPNSVTTTLGWDTRLNLNTIALSTTGGTLTTTYTHDAANNPASVQSPDGATLTYTRDAANRVTTITDIPGNTVNYNLDYLGNSTTTSLVDYSGGTYYIRYPAYDNLERKIRNTLSSSTYAYDPNSNLTSVTDPLSNTWTYAYDALNRLSTRTDPNSGTTAYTYDAHNRLTNVRDANGNSTSYVRDGFGEVTQVTSPDTGTTVLRYDKDGNLTQKVFAGGQTVNLTWDANDRNLTVSYPADSTLNISKTYDQSGHGFGKGRLTTVTDQAGSDSFTYDERGNITAESRVITGIGTLTTSTSFDANSNVSGITYPSGTAVAYSRDSMGNVTGIVATPPGASSATTVAGSITYYPFGPEKKLTFGNGIKGTHQYDDAYRASSREDFASGYGDFLNHAYAYYGNGSLNTITDSVRAANSQTLGYDALDRLTSASSGTGGYGTYAWTWDAVGNAATQVINSVTTTFSQNSGSNRLSQSVTGSTTTTVDTTSNGNILDFKISGTAITSYTYNAANQLSSATGPLGASATYEYGFDGQRILKTPSSGYPITYQYGQAAKELLSENDLHSGQTADYIYMDPGRDSRPIGQVDPTSGNVYYTHTDRQGTPQLLTDASQNIVWSAFYNPFGDTSSFGGTLTTQSLRLPGQYFDPETGNNHNGFRDYSGTLTRYVQSDPIGLGGGMNTYQYVKGNPFKYTDRLGLDPGSGSPTACQEGSIMCNSGPGGDPFLDPPDDDDSNPDPSGPGAGPVRNQPSCQSSWFSFIGTACAASPGSSDPNSGPGSSNPGSSPDSGPSFWQTLASLYQSVGQFAANAFTGFSVGVITQNPSAPTPFNPSVITQAYQATTGINSMETNISKFNINTPTTQRPPTITDVPYSPEPPNPK
jgi:RHS repeat-associated protein